jgi:hypothetical protein
LGNAVVKAGVARESRRRSQAEMALLQIPGEPYPRFVCETCDRRSESQPHDELLVAGWRQIGFEIYMCPLCMHMGRKSESQRPSVS